MYTFYYLYLYIINDMIKCKMQVSYNILRKLVSRQILDVLVVCVYDLCEFTSVHRLFKHPHINRGVKLCIIPCICANYLSDSRTPADMSEREKVNYVKGCMQYYNTVSEHCWVKYNQGLYSHYNLQDLAPKGTFAFQETGMIVIKACCVRSDGQSTLGKVGVN